MAGGMTRGRGPTLAGRAAAGSASAAPAPEPDLVALQDRPRSVLTRHCWVTGLPQYPWRWAGLLAKWRQDTGAGG